jgi:hypothetical protein
MSIIFNDVERLILERWTDVTGLIDAHETVQGRLEEQIQTIADRIGRWAKPQGYEVDSSPRMAEINAWRPAWADRRKDARVYFSVGGFYPTGFGKVETAHPYLWVYTSDKLKDSLRTDLAQRLRQALGSQAREWEAHDVDDWSPLGKYLVEYDNRFRVKLLSDPDAVFDFCTQHFPTLFSIADIIEAELNHVLK